MLALQIYKDSEAFPNKEVFGLTSQLRRSAVSVPSNIAEGFNRLNKQEKIQFYGIATGSIGEVQSQLLLAHGLGYLREPKLSEIFEQTVLAHKLVNGLIKSTRSRS